MKKRFFAALALSALAFCPLSFSAEGKVQGGDAGAPVKSQPALSERGPLVRPPAAPELRAAQEPAPVAAPTPELRVAPPLYPTPAQKAAVAAEVRFAPVLPPVPPPVPQPAVCPPLPEPTTGEPVAGPGVAPALLPIPTPASLTPLAPGSAGFYDPAAAMRGINLPDRKEVNAILKEFNSIGRSTMSLSLGRAGKYLPLIREELQAIGLPAELAALPLVESSYNPLAVSTAGAVGLWQFVAATARLNGLRVDSWVDERLDPVASTRAAARHLKDLYDRYGDWSLALAAYNAGAGSVDRAGGTKDGADFWELCSADRFRQQTRRYVPKFYAAMAIMTDPRAHGYDPMDETGALAYEEVPVKNPVSLAVIAERAGLAYEDLATINPGLKRGVTPPGDKPYLLRVPRGMGEKIGSLIAALPEKERLAFRRHKVASGETISRIAKKYGIEADSIAMINALKDPTRLKVGMELVIPVGASGKAKASGKGDKGQAQESREQVPAPVAKAEGKAPAPLSAAKAAPAPAEEHLVQKGDTLYSIAKLYGTSVDRLKAINGIGDGEVLAVGRKIKVARGD